MPATPDRHPERNSSGRPEPYRFGELSKILQSLLESPVETPGWELRHWRAVMARPVREGEFSRVVCDPRLQPLLEWVGANTGPLRRLGALAAIMALLDDAASGSAQPRSEVARGIPVGAVDVEELAAQMAAATSTARPLGLRARGQARVSLSPNMDYRPGAAPSGYRAPDVSPFVDLAARLLRRAGCNLGRDERLAVRLGAALDVAVEHWLGGAVPGAGLPEFPSEGALRSDRRLTVLLGRDRDLRYLVYGPQPGRGRPLQAACRRGLAYWVAVTLVAAHTGEEPPSVPTEVLAHWRLQLARIGSTAGTPDSTGLDSLDVPSA